MEEELTVKTIKKSPPMYFANINGGKSFIRIDIKEIVRELYLKVIVSLLLPMDFFADHIFNLNKEFQ